PLSAAKSGGAAGEEEADEGAELDAPPAPPAAGLPTLAAARAMLEPSMLVFLVAVWLCMLAKAAYYAFFPLYLTRQLGVPMQWVGLILSVGVLIEIFFMLGFGRLLRLLGLRGLMAVGAACDALRLALLFAYPNIYVAVGTQVFHGMSVLVVHVAPQIYLNHRAGERYRSSMQGLYCVAVLGSGQILGAALGGLVAQGTSLVTVFGLGAALGVAAAALFAIAFRDRPAMAEMAA
ncbi:MAG: MFS transporter, partial [Phycisphaeraceae bacterium]